ncbi:MAG: GNAT family N-acetyltransferase [Rhodothermales bacterium]|nr:GNAT family N-acetyltransferase [Rhodothermales bacterium]
MTIFDVTPENAAQQGFFCIRNQSNPGVERKRSWYEERYREGLRVKILRDDDGQQVAFVEYVPAEFAWRPVRAPGFIFIHCLSGYRKEHRGRGYASALIRHCENDARSQARAGVAVMTSDGPWMATMEVFLKNGYSVADRRGRFELLAKKFSTDAPDPLLIDWEKALAAYQGWHLIYADQCPWHEKAVRELADLALSEGIDLQVTRLKTAEQARSAPSGFGVMSLVHDGELIEDHYISKTRFRTILNNRRALHRRR